MFAVVAFVFTKFIAYCVFCSQAPRWFAFADPDAISFGARWGTGRFFVGIAAGFPIAFLFGISQEARFPDLLSYVVSFVPMRYLEWFVVFKLIAQSQQLAFGGRANTWILMGVAISSILDLIAWTVVEFGNVHLRFWC